MYFARLKRTPRQIIDPQVVALRNFLRIGEKQPSREPQVDFRSVVNNLLAQARQGIFQRKSFTIANKEKKLSAVYNFFQCKTEYDSKPEHKLVFKCMICSADIRSHHGISSNLHKHLRSHAEYKEWKLKFDEFNPSQDNEDEISRNVLDLVLYFISSNESAIQLENTHIRRLLSRLGFNLPHRLSFASTLIPEVVKKCKAEIERVLKNARAVTLVADIWTSVQIADFMGLCATTLSKGVERKTFVIGLKRMSGPHNAENIKDTIESIVNEYNFNKNKIVAVVCDEGSAFVRLFKQLLHSLDEETLETELTTAFEEEEEQEQQLQQTEEEQHAPNFDSVDTEIRVLLNELPLVSTTSSNARRSEDDHSNNT